MKKRLRILIIMFVGSIFLASCGYDRLVNHQEEVSKAWSEMENLCQLRMDMAGEMVESFGNPKGKALLEIEANRKKALEVAIATNPGKLGQEPVSLFEDAQENLKNAIDTFFIGAAKDIRFSSDPEVLSVKTDFKALNSKIDSSMLRFNESSLKYNSSRQKVWKIVMVKLAGFKPKGYFMKVNTGR